MQVNMVIPAGISRIGAISIQVTVGNATSPPGTTIFVGPINRGRPGKRTGDDDWRACPEEAITRLNSP